MSAGISMEQLREDTVALLQGAPQGDPLSPLVEAFIQYATRISVPTLDAEAAQAFAEECLDHGATLEQLHEVLTLVSGLGVHSFMEGSEKLAQLARQRGIHPAIEADTATEILNRWTGGSTYWETFNEHVPDFLEALARLSPSALEGFMMIGALPSKTRTVPAATKELISIAVDAMPTHRYMPGLALHVHNALKLGAGSREILSALDLAKATPGHRGVAARVGSEAATRGETAAS